MKRSLLLTSFLLALLPAVPAAAQLGKGREPWFDKADTNRDGIVTRDEFLAYRDRNFGEMDRNKDGVVSPADFPRLARFRPQAMDRLTQMLGRADSNGDGAISRQELAASPPTMFELADANGDGRVTRAEFDESRAEMRDRMQQRKN
ncbi:EF-hand domain-containing protein [Sphingobium ummariense]|uniref:EF-hand domain-containing protein n=1 Tax=Sphingobium ummariense RL-3 TaxID=1346791 RepID=T0INP3_9SPHN|nr:EF-hand domain-containing protein [Sphingobium ummariense]EQB30465.1 hypothetical protein M529_19120 [Sphingobium ummariense RL-3]